MPFEILNSNVHQFVNSSRKGRKILVIQLFGCPQIIFPDTQRFSFQRSKTEISNKSTAPKSISLRASMTVEAAVVLPVFVCLMVFIMFFMRIMWVEISVQNALDETSQQMAVVAAYQENMSLAEVIAICDAKVLQDDVAVSFIDSGLLGLDYSASSVEDNYVELRVSYNVTFPLKMFGSMCWNMTQVSINRKWVGWDPDEDTSSGEYVYITEYGNVYHTKLSCSYLNPTISAVSASEVSSQRNSSGHKYNACSSCSGTSNDSGTVYITDYGETYHVSLTCSGLKRTIYRKALSEVSGVSACSKCGE